MTIEHVESRHKAPCTEVRYAQMVTELRMRIDGETERVEVFGGRVFFGTLTLSIGETTKLAQQLGLQIARRIS